MDYSEEYIYYNEALDDDGDGDVNDVVQGILTKHTRHGNFLVWQILALVIFPWLGLCALCNFKIFPMSNPPLSVLLQPSSHGLAGDELTVAETDWGDDEDEHDDYDFDEIGFDNNNDNDNNNNNNNNNNKDNNNNTDTDDEDYDDNADADVDKFYVLEEGNTNIDT
jgi:hypothetical protein